MRTPCLTVGQNGRIVLCKWSDQIPSHCLHISLFPSHILQHIHGFSLVNLISSLNTFRTLNLPSSCQRCQADRNTSRNERVCGLETGHMIVKELAQHHTERDGDTWEIDCVKIRSYITRTQRLCKYRAPGARSGRAWQTIVTKIPS